MSQRETVQYNLERKNHKILSPLHHIYTWGGYLYESLPSYLDGSICFLIRNLKVIQAEHLCQQILSDEQFEYFIGTFSWQIWCQSWLLALNMFIWSNGNVIILSNHTLDWSLSSSSFILAMYLFKCSHLLLTITQF